MFTRPIWSLCSPSHVQVSLLKKVIYSETRVPNNVLLLKGLHLSSTPPLQLGTSIAV